MSVRTLIAIAAFVFWAGTASAQVCNFSITNFNFGNINLSSGGTAPTSGTMTITCSGNAGKSVNLCPNIGNGTGGSTNGSPRRLTNGTATVPYNLFQPSGQVWGSYLWAYAETPPAMTLTIGSSGSTTITQTIQAAISGSIASAITGLYTSKFSAADAELVYSYGASCSKGGGHSVQTSFTVQAQVTATCNLAVNAMSFGTIAGLTTAQATSNQISLTCTTGVPYTISLSNGSNGGTSPTNRYMISASNQKLSYGIFKDAAHMQAWGLTTGANTQAGTGSGTTQNLTAYALLPAQGNPSAGTYSDTVVVTINY